jgi:predicted nucleic acid-binding protein
VKYLVDTNVISELRKGPRCNRGVAAWFAGVPSGDLYLSVLTVGEIRKGIETIRRRDPLAAGALETWLLDLLAVHSDRILPLDLPVADLWGRFNAAAPLPAVDSLLCATARHHRLTLVTRNLADVSRTGVECLDPFSGPG